MAAALVRPVWTPVDVAETVRAAAQHQTHRGVKTLAVILAEPRQRAGVTAVLNAADTAHQDLEDAQWIASFAPPITSYRSCVCGSTVEVRGSDQIDVTAAERDAAAEAVANIMGRPRDAFAMQIVTRVLHAINHERAVTDGDADADWHSVHAACGDV